LLVLDTCEHLVNACARMAKTLLAAAPGLHIVATSRQPLDIRGERRVRVQPMSVASDPHGGVGGVGGVGGDVGGEAVTLFAQRAATAAPGLVLDAGNEGSQAVAARICR